MHCSKKLIGKGQDVGEGVYTGLLGSNGEAFGVSAVIGVTLGVWCFEVHALLLTVLKFDFPSCIAVESRAI